MESADCTGGPEKLERLEASREAILHSVVVAAACSQSGCSFEPMLCLSVPPEIHFPLEALPAQVTAKGFETCVFAAVGDEVGALAECLATHLALVGLLTCGNGRGRGGSMSL